MPVFDFKCEICKEVTPDILISNNEDIPKCACGGKLNKLFSNSAPGIIYRCGGFYNTDKNK